MTRWVVGELLTGAITADLDPLSGGWSNVLNAAGDVRAEILLSSLLHPVTGKRTLDLRLHTQPWRSFLAAIDEESGRVHQAGPIIGRPYSKDNTKVTLGAQGLWAYWFRRVLRQSLAPGQRLPETTVDFVPADGLSKGTVAKRLVELSMTLPGGGLPIDLPVESPGDTERHYPGHDAALLGDRLQQITEVENGPDIIFEPYLVDDLHLRWNMRVGTEADPYVHSSGMEQFDYTAPLGGTSNLQVSESSERMASLAFEMGGGQTDEVLAGYALDPHLLDQGWPLLEAVTNRSSVSEIATLDSYAAERVALGRTAAEVWTLGFNPRERPYITAYNVGDFAKLGLANDPWIPDGDYDVRIVGMSGDHTDRTVNVSFQERTGV